MILACRSPGELGSCRLKPARLKSSLWHGRAAHALSLVRRFVTSPLGGFMRKLMLKNLCWALRRAVYDISVCASFSAGDRGPLRNGFRSRGSWPGWPAAETVESKVDMAISEPPSLQHTCQSSPYHLLNEGSSVLLFECCSGRGQPMHHAPCHLRVLAQNRSTRVENVALADAMSHC